MNKKRFKFSPAMVFIYAFFTIMCIGIIAPIWIIVINSFVSKTTLNASGFVLWPKTFDFTSYGYIVKNYKSITTAFGNTILVTIAGTTFSVLVCSMFAYAMSRQDFFLRRVMSFFAVFTMFFGGGMSASYIMNVNVLQLKNTFWILILPGGFSVMNMIILRAYFEQLPYGIVESAKIDGASEYAVYTRIMLPLAKPSLATVALMGFVGNWNAYMGPMLYMDGDRWVTIQLLLQRLLQRVSVIEELGGMVSIDMSNVPSEGVQMAVCTITVLPVLLVFPRFQKYFVKGMAIGSVKG